MTYTVTDIYNTLFSNKCRQYDASIAEDFYEVDPEDMATLFFENIDKESFTHEEFKQVKSLASDFENLVHSNFNFHAYTEEDTGFQVVRVW